MMKWGEIEGRTWTVPGARMKTAGDDAPDYTVPLSPFAMAIIERARATHPGTPAKSDPGIPQWRLPQAFRRVGDD